MARVPVSGEDGTGLVPALAGLTVFLALLFFATHLLIGLYFNSVVTAATNDAARIVAGSGGEGTDAQAHVLGLLGSYGGDVRVTAADDGDFVAVTVVAQAPRLLWPGLMRAVGVETVERTVRVRRETLVESG
ncbi:MAG TPA: hypothetical protein VM324_16040 [Egibacteraceae bacterium]|jgi:hypothetical protein|nr:hypothetical protein [Egibacteraceae bacterium]